MRVSVSFVYISRAFVRERFSRNTNKRVSKLVRWGKNFKRNKKNCISFLAKRAELKPTNATTQNFKKKTTYQRFQNAALPARLTPDDRDLRQIDIRQFLQTSRGEYVL